MTLKIRNATRRCKLCSRNIESMKADADFCSNACKQRAYRLRHQQPRRKSA